MMPPPQTSSPLTLAIEGMTCASCVSRIEKALHRLPQIASISINLTTGLATLTPKNSTTLDPDLIRRTIQAAGYRATLLDLAAPAQTLATLATRHQAALLARRHQLTFGILAAIPVLLIDLTHTHLLPHLVFQPSAFSLQPFLPLAQLLLATAILAYTGRPFFTAAYRARLHPTMDTLISLGSLTAYLYSLALLIAWLWSQHSALSTQNFSPAPHTELHAAVTIIVLVSLGKYLEAKAKSAASNSIAHLAHQSSPTAALLLPDGSTQTIPAEQVQPGDLLQITAHQTLPVDGTLISGSGSLDQSLLTGESVPLELSAPEPRDGNPRPNVPPPPPPPPPPLDTQHSALSTQHSVLPAGALLLDGRIVLRATSTASQSTVSRILNLVQSAQASKTHIQALADQVSAIFVPIVLSLSFLTYLGWTLYSLTQHSELGTQHSLSAAIATIVIACPCALGLATPTALTVALNRAANLGILFTNAATLETAGTITTVIFDKTGTLTIGRFTLQEIVLANTHTNNNVRPSPQLSPQHSALSTSYLALAASIEQFSDHPLAQSITARAQALSLPLDTPDDFSSLPGGGLLATLHHHRYAIGSLRFLQSQHVDILPLQPTIDHLQSGGHTIIALANLGPVDLPPTPPIDPPGTPQIPGGQGRFDPPTPPNDGGVHLPTTAPYPLALFALKDELRPDALATLKMLHNSGIRTVVLSGDNEAAVRSALTNMPVDLWLFEVKPEQKAQKITEIRETQGQNGADAHQNRPKNTKKAPKNPQIAFVGDGINDAPALATADLGIALASGADLAKAAGDVILVSEHLIRVSQTLALARVTFRVIKQNLVWAFAYNLLALPLAMLGMLPPAAAAGAMVLSSLSVVGNALRLYRVKLR